MIDGRPVIERIVTVSGDGVKEPGNFKVLFGTNQRELVEAAGGFLGEPEKVISGGPMMGFAMFTLDTPITKTSSSILCLTKDEVAANEPSACINCGRCVEAVSYTHLDVYKRQGCCCALCTDIRNCMSV